LIYLPSAYLLAHNCEATQKFCLSDLVFTLVLDFIPIITNIGQSNTALQALVPRQRIRFQLTCSNPNCRHQGHIIATYYWQREKKEKQFSLGFVKRDGTRGTAAYIQQGDFKIKMTIDNATTNEEAKEAIFVPITTTNELKILITLFLNTSMFSNKNSTYSYQLIVKQENVKAGI